MMKYISLKLLFIMIGLAVLNACSTTSTRVMAPGTEVYRAGTLKTAEAVDLDRGWDATLQALDELEFSPVSKQKDALEAKVELPRADDSKIVIHLKKQTGSITLFTIKVGKGDESLSRVIFEKIKTYL